MLETWQENLFKAIINQDMEKLKHILIEAQNKRLNFTNEEGNTPLHFASDIKAEIGTQIVKYLLRKGCEPNAVNSSFETAYERATQNKNEATMLILEKSMLLEQKKNQEELDNFIPEDIFIWKD